MQEILLIFLLLNNLFLCCSKSTETLMSESGCCLEHVVATKFRQYIEQGHWSKVEATLPEIKPLLKKQRYLQVCFYKEVCSIKNKFVG